MQTNNVETGSYDDFFSMPNASWYLIKLWYEFCFVGYCENARSINEEIMKNPLGCKVI